MIQEKVKRAIADTYSPVSTPYSDYAALDRIERLSVLVGFIASRLPPQEQQEISAFLDELSEADSKRAQRIWGR